MVLGAPDCGESSPPFLSPGAGLTLLTDVQASFPAQTQDRLCPLPPREGPQGLNRPSGLCLEVTGALAIDALLSKFSSPPRTGQQKRLSSTRFRLKRVEPLSSWGPERRYGEEFLPIVQNRK